MRIKMFTIFWIITSVVLSSPAYEEGIRYYVKYDLKNKIHTRDGDQSVTYSITKGSKIYVEKVMNSEIIFKVTSFMKPKPLNPNLTYVEPGKLYKINLNDIEEYDLRKLSGFSGGIATTPFKYRPDKEKFYPGGNLAAAGSYWYNFFGFTVKPMVFAGLTTISLADVNSQNRDTETKMGFTMGSGVSFNVVGEFDLGIIIGWDFVDKDWDSNKKSWYAFSFGYSFF